MVVADAGLLSNDNIALLQNQQYEYILGARIKNEKLGVQKQILALGLESGQCAEIRKDENTRLIVSYSACRAKRDEFNRQRGLQKLEKAVAKGKLDKTEVIGSASL